MSQIYFIRGEKVMFDRDLAELYGVDTRTLNQAVKRNADRFPKDFMFQLSEKELSAFSRFQNDTLNDSNSLRSQIVTLNGKTRSRSQFVILKRGQNIKYSPYVFTEQGVAMLSAVLKSKRAVAVSIQIVRTFVKLREILSTHKQLREKVELMENKYDKSFKVVFQMIARLMKEDTEPKKRIGFYDKSL
ncbi:MAG: ORF6N domain-containing protein [Candidatus Moraniibacteriota bacterium]